jgi:DNA-binding MarR family transcriptional regulator
MSRGLSALQYAILEFALAHFRPDDLGVSVQALIESCVGVKPIRSVIEKSQYRSMHSSMSRALRRLEKRGLIKSIRLVFDPCKRMRLTQRGVETTMARRINQGIWSENSPEVAAIRELVNSTIVFEDYLLTQSMLEAGVDIGGKILKVDPSATVLAAVGSAEKRRHRKPLEKSISKLPYRCDTLRQGG